MEKITGGLLCDAPDIEVEGAVFRLPDGQDANVPIVHRPAWVGVLPFRPPAAAGGGVEVLLTRQVQPAVDEPALLQLVGGTVGDPGDPLATAQRKLVDQTGLQGQMWTDLARNLLPAPEFLREPVHLFAVWELTPVPGQAASGAGTWIGLRDALRMVGAGEIRDMRTIIAVHQLACETSRTHIGRPWWPCRWCDTRNLTSAPTCRVCGR